MDKKQLIEVLETSLLYKRLMEVVNVGAVKVGNELFILKQRPSFEFKEDEAILYGEHHDMHYHYRDILAKTVIFDHSLFNIRGQNAISEYLDKNSILQDQK